MGWLQDQANKLLAPTADRMVGNANKELAKPSVTSTNAAPVLQPPKRPDNANQYGSAADRKAYEDYIAKWKEYQQNKTGQPK